MQNPKQELRSIFHEAGLFLAEEERIEIGNEIRLHGKELAAAFMKKHPATWSGACRSIAPARSTDDLERVLAFGNCISEYAMRKYPFSESVKKELCEAAAICNLLVSLYDHYMDEADSLFYFPEEALIRLLTVADTTLIEQIKLGGSVPQQTIALLAEIYLDSVRKIAGDAYDKPVWKTLTKSIRLMLFAENETIQQGQNSSFNSLIRKSALPFLTMTLPIHLHKPLKANSDYFKEFRHLYEIGILFGLVDDAADYLIDQKSGAANVFLRKNSKEIPDAHFIRSLVRKVFLNSYDAGEKLLEQKKAMKNIIFFVEIWLG
jgi:hypothetical protein